ncbi:MAG: dihydrofolate reductase family protein [Candidatus Sulfotelmatobacter sp.]
MRRIRYGVAASLDGFIAGPNGEVDWITLDPEVDFAEIWAQFDTLLMGRRTYEVAVQRLSEAAFVGITSAVFSRTLQQEQHPKVKVVPELTREWVTSLKAQTGKDVWLMGGSSLFRSFLDSGYVDRIDVMVIPVVLGAGIPLLPPPYSPTKLKLLSNRVYRSGRLSLAYEVQH